MTLFHFLKTAFESQGNQLSKNQLKIQKYDYDNIYIPTPHILLSGSFILRLPWWLSGKESACQCRFDPWFSKIPWRRKRQPTTVFLPGKSHGQRSLWATVHGAVKESDRT